MNMKLHQRPMLSVVLFTVLLTTSCSIHTNPVSIVIIDQSQRNPATSHQSTTISQADDDPVQGLGLPMPVMPASAPLPPAVPASYQLPAPPVIRIPPRSNVTGCGPFIPPADEAVPKLDQKRLQAVPANDQAALDNLLLDHIQELKRYAERVKRVHDEAYDRYRRTCRK